MPQDPNDTLEAQLLRKASSIGAPGIGTQILPTENPSLFDLIKRIIGPERPASVAAQDPYGDKAWMAGKGPAPALMMGSTEGVGGEAQATGGKLFSRLQKAFEEAPDWMHPSKALNWAKQRASQEEINWRKLPEFLATKGNEGVSKGEILQHLAQNPIDLGETVMGPGPTTSAEYRTLGPDRTKYSQYQTPGGANYKETLTQLETKGGSKIGPIEKTPTIEHEEDGVFGFAPPIQHQTYRAPLLNEPDSYIFGATPEDVIKNAGNDRPNAYRSPHFYEPNILVHTRSNERTLPHESGAPSAIRLTNDHGGDLTVGTNSPTVSLADKNNWKVNPLGPKGTFLEEVQSDWHQAGKERGYRADNPETSLAPMRKRLEEIGNEEARLPLPGDSGYTEGVRGRISDLHRERETIFTRMNGLEFGVPDAPFKESWPDLALKKHLLEVAKSPDQNWLGWTPGSIQNKRYDLANHVSSIEYNPTTGYFGATDLHGQMLNGIPIHVTPSELVNYVGKDVAHELITNPSTKFPDLGGFGDLHTLNFDTNNPKEIGGAGMRHFYDNLLPARMNKILKPFGGKVEQAELPTGKTVASRSFLDEKGISPAGDTVGVGQGRVYDQNTGEVVAQALPRDPDKGWTDTRSSNVNWLLGKLNSQYTKPETFPAWIAKLTPEMKARIAKEGLPLLTSLYMVYQHEAGQKGQPDAQPQP